jgi:DNA-directed RNA polymerase subunit beta'
MLDAIKNMVSSTPPSGATIGMDEIVIPAEKASMIDSANKQVVSIQKQYLAGHITQTSAIQVVEVWSKTNEELTSVMMKALENDKGGFNNIYMMAYSGAGEAAQIRQLAGMRGLMAKPSGVIIELPIRSNFREGLSVIEFFSPQRRPQGSGRHRAQDRRRGLLTRRWWISPRTWCKRGRQRHHQRFDLHPRSRTARKSSSPARANHRQVHLDPIRHRSPAR